MKARHKLTGLSVGLLALQVVCQSFWAALAIGSVRWDWYWFEESVQTFDGLILTPFTTLFLLLIVGFGIFRTPRLSLIVTLTMLLPSIAAAIAFARDPECWDPEIQEKIRTADQAILYLRIVMYAVCALIAGFVALAVRRAVAKAIPTAGTATQSPSARSE